MCPHEWHTNTLCSPSPFKTFQKHVKISLKEGDLKIGVNSKLKILHFDFKDSQSETVVSGHCQDFLLEMIYASI